MNADAAASLLQQHFGHGATICHQFNHGNPENLSFSVDTADEQLWVKVSASREDDAVLLQWAAMSPLLTENYWAPAVLRSIRVGSRAALVFERLVGRAATADDLRQRLPDVLGLLDRLHTDDAITAALTPAGPMANAGECFRATWIRRFRDDLQIINGRVPFVDERLLEWMHAETDTAEELTEAAAFKAPTLAPIHGDLWPENILVGPDRWWILDWDDLAFGDAVVDDAIVLFNAVSPTAVAWFDVRPPRNADEATRFELAARLQLLDAVIDNCADWMGTGMVAERESTRLLKESAHRGALTDYRSRYG
ncbi:MAG: aminoglycoside phosphotransferase family protein [Actinomycetota bacterium]|nr:aminoglycoside phosphotransferase family protein [Actinomycetota bacterium]